MFRRFSANFAVISIFADALIMALSLYLSVKLRNFFSFLPFVKFIPIQVTLPIGFFFLFPLIWVSIFLLFALYDGRRNLRIVDELTSLTLGTLLASVSMAGVLYFSLREVSRFLFLFFVALAYFLMLLWRLVYRMVYRYRLIEGLHKRRVLIVGAGEVGVRLGKQIEQRGDFGLELVGYLDDRHKSREYDIEIMGRMEEVRSIIQAYQVDDVVLALPRAAEDRLNRLVSNLHDQPVRVWVLLDYFALSLHHAEVCEFAGIPMLDLRAPALDEYQRMTKRAFDLLITLLLMPLALPLMALISLVICLDSPGGVFYKPWRVGENGKLFRMYKFRTMVANADQMRHLVERRDAEGRVIHKVPDDPRVTRVGRFLRRSSLDELPQLFNVLRGEMSLVGPRPEMPDLVEKYDLWQRKRFAVPQGMTGWWQIGGRSDHPMHLHTEEDLYYVQNYSIWLDIQILVKTVWVVLRGKGAY
ncbi:MAG: sugar transferase [Anaerolineae bacterium]|nr:sugar transferase [Anaerolineae bacterium]